MSLTRITSPRRVRAITVYDLEWKPSNMELRLIGVYDEERGYRAYGTVAAFLNAELTHRSRGRWFFAHAGGMADVLFLLEYLVQDERYSVEASFSGSSAIIVRIKRGKHTWVFCDSLWLFRDSLRNIGKSVGIDKGNEEESIEFFESASQSELIPYNRTDCRILYTAIDRFQTRLLEEGSQLKATIASCGLELFRRVFLKRDVETCPTVNEIGRSAYFASRVEVLTTHCDKAYYYDINSSFPFSMTAPLPGAFRRSVSRKPDHGIYFARVRVHVPDMYLPPLPKRVKERLFFPTGIWEGWYCNVDLDLLQSVGGRILKVYECLTFHEITDFGDYVRRIWAHRQNAEGFDRVLDKYLLNCLYGKLAEQSQKTRLTLRGSQPGYVEDQVGPAMYLEDVIVDVPHVHVPISAYVTALSRRLLYDFMSQSPDLHYCDTDGFSTTIEYPTGPGLGALKLEKLIDRGRFVAPKIYGLDGIDADGKQLQVRRAKGFSLPKTELGKAEVFAKIVDGIPHGGIGYLEAEELNRRQEVTFVRMRRLREMLRRGDLRPSQANLKKKLRNSIPKRYIYPDGHTRPWQLNELEVLK